MKREQKKIQHEESESNWLVSYADMMTLLVGFFVMLQSMSSLNAHSYEQVKKETSRLFGGEYKIPFEKLTSSIKEILKKQGIQDQVNIRDSEEGVELTFRGALFFDSGSSVLKPEALDLLSKLVPEIKNEAKGYYIVAEGYTDNRPIQGGIFASNWELSSVRACTIIRYFESQGFEKQKLKALGWGETHPLLPNEDEHGNPLPQNQAQNRRVVIKIRKSDT